MKIITNLLKDAHDEWLVRTVRTKLNKYSLNSTTLYLHTTRDKFVACVSGKYVNITCITVMKCHKKTCKPGSSPPCPQNLVSTVGRQTTISKLRCVFTRFKRLWDMKSDKMTQKVLKNLILTPKLNINS